MTSLIPAPIRNVFAKEILEFKADQARNAFQQSGMDPSCEGAASASFGLSNAKLGAYAYDSSLRNQALLRVALAVAGIYAVKAFALNPYTLAAVGACVSLPATLTALGAYAVVSGLPMVISSISSGSFAALGTGVALTAGGWLSLEHHDLIPFGLADMLPGRMF